MTLVGPTGASKDTVRGRLPLIGSSWFPLWSELVVSYDQLTQVADILAHATASAGGR
jgi:hypothetical protein